MLRAARWYDRHRDQLGDRFLDELRVGFLAIVEFPSAHPSVASDVRRWLFKDVSYGIIYRIERDTIVIIAIANLKRRPRYWVRRKSV